MIVFRKSVCLYLSLGFFFLMTMNNAYTYPISQPQTEGYLQVSQKHQICYATYGNPEGIPVVVLHGGPGLGYSDEDTYFFDPASWHIVMFDQRGAMRSRPFACMEENTTQHSVNDIELLREHLGVDQWVVFGGSWGSCLALAYGEQHPEACLGFILRGVFLGREQDIGFFKNMGKRSPEAYQTLLTHFSEEEQSSVPQSCYQKLMDPNPEIHNAMARALLRYSITNTTTPPSMLQVEEMLKNDHFNLSFMRSFVHYALHQCFLQPNQILSQLDRISHLPAIIVHGALDTVCAPEQARQLHENWKTSQLWIVEDSGHSSREPGIAKALIKATDALRETQHAADPIQKF